MNEQQTASTPVAKPKLTNNVLQEIADGITVAFQLNGTKTFLSLRVSPIGDYSMVSCEPNVGQFRLSGYKHDGKLIAEVFIESLEFPGTYWNTVSSVEDLPNAIILGPKPESITLTADSENTMLISFARSVKPPAPFMQQITNNTHYFAFGFDSPAHYLFDVIVQKSPLA
ncbi:hypothetical protein [Mucilaginibacter lappiensis]|uniref:Uncharacterized protein n=1 Tax=Mucilaginibacter lappiensis TaxID=354630 RepID=A0A841JIF5_9SPHI|nr:hypothetical protein [Mucilaginibacter lappiensis]MBB6130943.1 hypothetical protein [Mucilaginibacter lappiensis]